MPDRLVQAILTAIPVGRKTVLHVGCGAADPAKLHRSFREGNWRELRLDIDPSVAPDIVASMAAMPTVADASVDAVWSQRGLDTLPPGEWLRALAEFRRVLDVDGFALVTVAETLMPGDRLGRMLREAGFAHVEVSTRAAQHWAKASTASPQSAAA